MKGGRTRPRFLLDVDGPLTEGFVAEACRLLREAKWPNVHRAFPEHIDQWDIMRALDVPKVIEDEVYNRLREPGVAFKFEPNAGAVEFVDWCRTWMDVFIVTSPLGGPHWAHDRERWLNARFGFDKKHIASVHTKYIVHGDAFMDDKPSHIQEWQDENPRGLAILWRIPPNRTASWPATASTYVEARKILEDWRDR